MPFAQTSRRLRMGLQTLLGAAIGLPRRGFFIPYRYADTVSTRQPAYEAPEALFAASGAGFLSLLEMASAFSVELSAIAHGDDKAPAPRFTQSWFPTLDAAVAYAIVRQNRPGRIVEVGSGHSTRFLCRAVQDGGFESDIVAIDPEPRASLSGLPVRFLPAVVQTASPAIFSALEPGDILFIDSSHILMPGTDVDWLFNRILPLLPAGVLVHIHDIFLPDDYPPDWLWRGYNEQQLLGPMLSGGWEILFASHYVATRMQAALAGSIISRLPVSPEARPASLWLRRRP